MKRSSKLAIPFLGLLLAGVSVILPGCGSGVTNPIDNSTTPTAKYVGADRCVVCHKRVHESWSQTGHAGALGLLKSIGQDTNTACLPCHTVGFGEEGGYVDNPTTPNLANVQCESCHGPGLDHVNNVADKTLRPTKSISSAVCGKCHTDAHVAGAPSIPTYEEWAAGSHGKVSEHPGDSFNVGSSLLSCGVCHSGDYRQQVLNEGNTITDTFLKDVPIDQMNSQTCAICHDPHEQTGNDKGIGIEPGHDFQLRYPKVAFPTPSDNTTLTTNPARFNICGQCHHSRGANWTAGSRGPHHSIQANMYAGEMDSSDNKTSLVPNEGSVHSFVPGQCTTCHMYRVDVVDLPGTAEDTPAIGGHSFAINFKACFGVAGCHPTEENVIALQTTFQAEIQAGLDSIKTRLGAVSTWEYSSSGGPTDQKTVSNDIKKVRFLYYWIINDLSLGIHNPEYARSIINKANALLTSAGK